MPFPISGFSQLKRVICALFVPLRFCGGTSAPSVGGFPKRMPTSCASRKSDAVYVIPTLFAAKAEVCATGHWRARDPCHSFVNRLIEHREPGSSQVLVRLSFVYPIVGRNRLLWSTNAMARIGRRIVLPRALVYDCMPKPRVQHRRFCDLANPSGALRVLAGISTSGNLAQMCKVCQNRPRTTAT